MTAKVKTAPQSANAARETVRACSLHMCEMHTYTHIHTLAHSLKHTHTYTLYLRIVHFVNKNFATNIKFATEVISRLEHRAARRDFTSKLTNEVTSGKREGIRGSRRGGAGTAELLLAGAKEVERVRGIKQRYKLSVSVCVSVCISDYKVIGFKLQHTVTHRAKHMRATPATDSCTTSRCNKFN